ncbi:hypothetical protein TNCV_332211 [Trichonephila clavipes]|nr:hypothetical protein TNCV_332211 [Trichonephila clavipes]
MRTPNWFLNPKFAKWKPSTSWEYASMVLQKSKHSAEFLMRDNWSRSSSISGGEMTVLGVAVVTTTDGFRRSIHLHERAKEKQSGGKRHPRQFKRAVLYNEEPRVEKKAGR